MIPTLSAREPDSTQSPFGAQPAQTGLDAPMRPQ